MSTDANPKKITRAAALKLTLADQKPSFQPTHRSTELFEENPFTRSPRVGRSPVRSPVQAITPTTEEITIVDEPDRAPGQDKGKESRTVETGKKSLKLQDKMADITLSTSLSNPKNPATPKFLSPPIFNPCSKNATTFMKVYERTAAANGWDNQLKIAYFQTFLEGAADLWFERYKNSVENTEKSWEDIKDDFQKEFEGGDTRRILEERLHERRQKANESLTAYYYDLQTLFGEYDPSFDISNFQKYFENGLLPHFYENYKLLLDDNMDWSKFKKIVNKLDDISNRTSKTYPPRNIQNNLHFSEDHWWVQGHQQESSH